jgi:hypothetical protein
MCDVLDWAWRIGADEVFFKSLSLGSVTSQEQKRRGRRLLPTRPEFRRNALPARTPCRYPAEHTMVYWNGDLGVCCVDFNNMADLPGIPSLGGLLPAMRSDEVQQARLRGQRTKHPLCGQCQSVGAGFRGLRVPLHRLRAETPQQTPPCWPDVLDQQRQTTERHCAVPSPSSSRVKQRTTSS